MSSKSTKKKSAAPKTALSLKKHVLPPLIGILIMVGGFSLLNSQWIAAQIKSRLHSQSSSQFIDIATVSAAPAANIPPTIIIPNINVNAPVVVDIQSHNEADVQMGLKRGVLHYGSTAFPGQKGNVVLFGHSSAQVWAPGDYKFVFTLLNTLRENDPIIIDYEGTRYIYRVTDTKIVPPTDFSVVQQTDIPELTLITCTPVGTNKNRLIVHAKQVTPDPMTSTPRGTEATQLISAGLLPQ